MKAHIKRSVVYRQTTPRELSIPQRVAQAQLPKLEAKVAELVVWEAFLLKARASVEKEIDTLTTALDPANYARAPINSNPHARSRLEMRRSQCHDTLDAIDHGYHSEAHPGGDLPSLAQAAGFAPQEGSFFVLNGRPGLGNTQRKLDRLREEIAEAQRTFANP